MNNGLSRFSFYLQQINVLISNAKQQKNAALWLYNNNARTPFFMLESLAKLHSGFHHQKKFKKLKDHFKQIEDGLGKIDYYHSLIVSFTNNKKIPISHKQYIKHQFEHQVAQLNITLLENNWIKNGDNRIKKIEKKLNEVNWLTPQDEAVEIEKYYQLSINKINEFVSKTNYHFDNVEEDVHELRRKLRWLSIYPHALQGLIQFNKQTKAAAHLNKYFTKEIIQSPYNQFPKLEAKQLIVKLDKNYFLSLSWLITELGKLKDEGLLIIGLLETITHTDKLTNDKAETKVYELLGKKQRTLHVILNKAELITKTYFKENNLQHIMVNNKIKDFV